MNIKKIAPPVVTVVALALAMRGGIVPQEVSANPNPQTQCVRQAFEQSANMALRKIQQEGDIAIREIDTNASISYQKSAQEYQQQVTSVGVGQQLASLFGGGGTPSYVVGQGAYISAYAGQANANNRITENTQNKTDTVKLELDGLYNRVTLIGNSAYDNMGYGNAPKIAVRTTAEINTDIRVTWTRLAIKIPELNRTPPVMASPVKLCGL